MFKHTSETNGDTTPLRPSNPEDFALGKFLSICKTSNIYSYLHPCIRTYGLKML